jgi:release factor glutamine methyltransferase
VLDPDPVVARLRAAGCVFAEDEAALLRAASRSPDDLEALLARRVAGVPLEQVLGWAEFCGLRLAVAPGVFVPRRRSEFLAETAVALVRPGDVVVDPCCGTGALGAVIVAHVAVELHATDVDPDAVRCARRNLPNASVHEGNLFDPLPERLRSRVALVVANAPYVPTAAIALMPPEARDHEHRIALDGGADGLDVQRAVIAAAPGWLRPAGHLLVETSAEQARVTTELLRAAGFAAHIAVDDERAATIAVATSPP